MRKLKKIISAVLLAAGFLIIFTSCDPVLGEQPESFTYTGKIANLTYDFDSDTADPTVSDISFSWTNPVDSNFCGVKIYVGDELFATTDKSETSCIVEALDVGTTYNFTFKAVGKSSAGVEADSSSPVVKRLRVAYADPSQYLGELESLTCTVNGDEATFNWENPTDTRFCGVSIYLDDVKIEDIDKSVTSYTIRDLTTGKHTFKFAARGKNKLGIIVETQNPTTRTANIVSLVEYKFIGRGYDTEGGEYFHYGPDLKDQIIEFTEEFRPTVDKNVNSSKSYTIAGESLSSYQKTSMPALV